MRARVWRQSCVVAAVGYFAIGLALAQSTIDCSTVSEDMARLKCYDEQSARQKNYTGERPTMSAPATPAASTRPTTSPPTATAATPTPARASSATSDFGLNADAIRKRQAATNPDTPKEPDQITARVKAVTTKARGEYRITLDDGQVWEETQHSSTNLAPNVGETVTIKRGLLGSYFLSHSAGLALRVKRTD